MICNIVGLVMNLVGVVLLFRYGMPYRVRTGGDLILWKTGRAPDPAVVALERRYVVPGWAGLLLIITGTAFQIAAAGAFCR